MLNANLTIEPIKSFKIQLTFNRNESRNYTSQFRYDDTINDWRDFSFTETGNFSMRNVFWKTAFEKTGSDYKSEAYDNFQITATPWHRIFQRKMQGP
jgi:hypothetical protein